MKFLPVFSLKSSPKWLPSMQTSQDYRLGGNLAEITPCNNLIFMTVGDPDFNSQTGILGRRNRSCDKILTILGSDRGLIAVRTIIETLCVIKMSVHASY